MQRVVGRGRRLLQAVSCPALEADVTGLADRWLQVTSDTAAHITRWVNSQYKGKVQGDGGGRVGEVRAGTTSPMPEHKGFKIQ